jgi:hypothetical protein
VPRGYDDDVTTVVGPLHGGDESDHVRLPKNDLSLGSARARKVLASNKSAERAPIVGGFVRGQVHCLGVQRGPNRRGSELEFFARWHAPKGRDASSLVELEAVPSEPRNDVKMDVWNELRCHWTVGEEQGETFATKRRVPESGAKALRGTKDGSCEIGRELDQARRVLMRND